MTLESVSIRNHLLSVVETWIFLFYYKIRENGREDQNGLCSGAYSWVDRPTLSLARFFFFFFCIH